VRGVIDNPEIDATELLTQDGTWVIDPRRSEVGFAAKALGGLMTVRGVFGAFDGQLRIEAGVGAGELRVEAASLDTGNEKRDRHLRSPDFFAVERHPGIVFVASEIVPHDGGLAVAGELAIRESQMRLELPISVEPIAAGVLRLEGSVRVSRKAAGMTWNWLGALGDEVALRAELTLQHSQ
jgi:polyisoprenoid-binding protein YceI